MFRTSADLVQTIEGRRGNGARWWRVLCGNSLVGWSPAG
jgi:hypothetical protein